MKRSILISLALALVLGACGGGKSIGKDLKVCETGQTPEKDNCVRQEDLTPTVKPTTTKKPSVRPTTVKPTKKAVGPCDYKGKEYPVIIRDPSTRYKPETLRVLRGDWIVFKNLDPDYEHSMTVTDGGKGLDSGILPTDGTGGKNPPTKKMRVMVKPKLFPEWRDKNVTYISGGPLEVLANPRCKG